MDGIVPHEEDVHVEDTSPFTTCVLQNGLLTILPPGLVIVMVIEVIHHAFGGRERGLKDKEDCVGVLNVLLLLGGGHLRALMESWICSSSISFFRLDSDLSLECSGSSGPFLAPAE